MSENLIPIPIHAIESNDWNQNDEVEKVVTISGKVIVVFLYTRQDLYSFCVELIVMF